MTAERRSIKFENLDQVVLKLDQLLAQGYTKTGNWDLSAICGHLNDWMRFSIDGYPKSPLPIRFVLWLMKVTMGRRQLDSVLKKGFRDRLPTMPGTVYDTDRSTDAEAVSQLTDTINRFKVFAGPVHPSPLYGPLTHDEALQLQLAHCSHHLKFLTPKTP
ncbi:hypothetical protein CA13_50850 [Planctomycetes bacterium CA13]|uniref:DinB superfamily protein n=1 Tax=Novipirellula herctigrandis TaxID=2527986 RepID=A0A5C5Z8R2_9BACT|nr:hypothetical protein CA13_50850 [Planctomycetes bacterium CA13]